MDLPIMWTQRLFPFYTVLLLLFCIATANATPLPARWNTATFKYTADHKDLKDVLRDFASGQGVITWISPEVVGSVSGNFSTTPKSFLNTLSASFGFVWYYDGTILWIWGANEIKTATINLSYADVSSIKAALSTMKVLDKRFPIRYDQAARTLIVSGPPGYVERVSAIAHSIDRVQSKQERTVIRVFPLRYARAADRSTDMDGNRVVTPGIATLLRSIFMLPNNNPTSVQASYGEPQRLTGLQGETNTSENQPSTTTLGLPNSWFSGRNTNPAQARPPLPSAGINDTGLGGGNVATADATPLPANGSLGLGAASQSTAQNNAIGIVADPRTNSVIVRDNEDRMDDYASLIHQLDSRPALLEIDATIIEVQEGAMRDLGVDWRAHTHRLDVQLGQGTTEPLNYPDDRSQLGATNATLGPAGAAITAVLGDSGRYLMSRVTALEQENKAKIVSNPKVTTLNNVEALMDQRQRFYVRVAGNQSADLFSVSAGISLRVLPTVIPDQNDDQIRMEVTIEDGNLTTQTVDQIPVVDTSQITTQALIREGQSLLIAGYENTEDSNTKTGVPGLSKIPVLGRLFQRRNKNHSRVQRLFLLTPHLVN